MNKINIALLGGDKREMEVLRGLLPLARVRCWGLPQVENLADSLLAALTGADAVILPMPGVDETGRLYAPLADGDVYLSREDLAVLRPGVPVLVGVASGYLRDVCGELGLALYQLAEDDRVALPNAVPTAEGALAVLMAETDVTISGMSVVVLGFGRVGEAVAQRLRALGADVLVANRGAGRADRAREQGFRLAEWADWPKRLMGEHCVVINTVPAQVLGRAELAALPRGVLVLDLASGAGGVDVAAADDLGVRVVRALSLPGKVAPVTAGRILAGVYPQFLQDVCGLHELGASENIKKNINKGGGDDGGH